MDWGLITVIVAIVLLGGHIAFDLRTLLKNLSRLGHDVTANLAACELCHAKARGGRELRHEALWTVGAVVVLTAHIVMDFTL